MRRMWAWLVIASISIQSTSIAQSVAGARPPESLIEAMADMRLIYGACNKQLDLGSANADMAEFNNPDVQELMAEAERVGRLAADKWSEQKCRDQARAAIDNVKDFTFYAKLSKSDPTTFQSIADTCRTTNPKFDTIGRSCWIAIRTAESLKPDR